MYAFIVNNFFSVNKLFSVRERIVDNLANNPFHEV